MRNSQGPLSARRQTSEAEAAHNRNLQYNLKGIDDWLVRTVAKDSTGMGPHNQIRVIGNVTAIEALRRSERFVTLRSDNADCVWTENLRSRSVVTDLVIAVRIRTEEVIHHLHHSDEEEEGMGVAPDLLQSRREFL